MQVHLKQKQEVWELWLEDPRVGKPCYEDDGPKKGVKSLLPYHCREMVRTESNHLWQSHS